MNNTIREYLTMYQNEFDEWLEKKVKTHNK